MDERIAFVAGSAHLDILSRVTGDDLPVDKIGDVSIEIGGTGCNIAINLAQMGAKTRFMTAMNRSPYSAIITEHLSASGLNTIVEYQDGLPTAAFCGQIDHDGELMTAVSSMPVDRYAFTELQVTEAMQGAWCAIADCNLAPSNLDTIVAVANKLMVPVYIAAVSEEKSLRIKGIQGKVDGIFLNKLEMAYLRANVTPSASSLVEMAQALDTTLIVTRDAEGVEIAMPNGHVERVAAPVIDGEKGHFLGAGDAFMSATVYQHIFNVEPLGKAAQSAMSAVERLIRHGNCNMGDERAVERILMRVNDSATKDGMTGLLNRATIEQQLLNMVTRCNAQGGKMSIAIVDIDHFKAINDTYGHPTGDTVIADVAGVIQRAVRGNDLVGRWGGEEFVCVFPDASRKTASIIADRIRGRVELLGSMPGPITVSIGVAEFQQDIDNLNSLVHRADQALYNAKRNGRNLVEIATNSLPV